MIGVDLSRFVPFATLMQALNPLTTDGPLTGAAARPKLRGRLVELEGTIGGDALRGLLALIDDTQRSPEAVRDALSTGLMDVFRLDRCRACFGLLYELNAAQLLVQVQGRLRRYSSKADPLDVLQEVFFNVYRYPHRFNAARDDAFRVWSAMIVRNSVLKHLRSQGRGGRQEVPFEDLSDQPETTASNPLTGVIQQESDDECARVYVTYLHLYMEFYSMLSDRERRALYLVEVEGLTYRDTAIDLSIKLENLKMVIFRARRKIHRAMRCVFEGQPHDCKPARDPKPITRRGGQSVSLAGAKGADSSSSDSTAPILDRDQGEKPS